MMRDYQKCPVCDGTGLVSHAGTLTGYACCVCQGSGTVLRPTPVPVLNEEPHG